MELTTTQHWDSQEPNLHLCELQLRNADFTTMASVFLLQTSAKFKLRKLNGTIYSENKSYPIPPPKKKTGKNFGNSSPLLLSMFRASPRRKKNPRKLVKMFRSRLYLRAAPGISPSKSANSTAFLWLHAPSVDFSVGQQQNLRMGCWHVATSPKSRHFLAPLIFVAVFFHKNRRQKDFEGPKIRTLSPFCTPWHMKFEWHILPTAMTT